MGIGTLLITMGIPSAVTAFCFWLVERRMNQRDAVEKEAREKRQRDVDRKEENREKLQLTVIQSVNASIALAEATARAVQRIPDAHCNGDMHAALEYASKVKHEQKEFLTKQGINNLYED
jgi:hypothetical protein